ncbi:hypothetical protein PMNALOAF_3221 [Methylobacterium adhaesivum]|jgi:hypothetical protein|uniref:Ribosomal protein S27 n=1 Tax=Methylobacterium adhaesivum TaxID=333297 RepID=A0ABT8BD55_9HYPH|nr:hypothetical protein [Methylobacterium adhaesivum]MDN3589223.1 hypothetical protein [Methylobacterium adhaesivum]GJD31956.1 hypothetical protein PMNALOAF_3221 [Methylobacterium adhaesivum]
MSDLLSVALVCASLVPTDHCSRATALDVIVSPARTPMECLVHGQVVAASTNLLEGDDRYLKVTCERRHADLRRLRRAGYAAAVVLVPRDAI